MIRSHCCEGIPSTQAWSITASSSSSKHSKDAAIQSVGDTRQHTNRGESRRHSQDASKRRVNLMCTLSVQLLKGLRRRLINKDKPNVVEFTETQYLSMLKCSSRNVTSCRCGASKHEIHNHQSHPYLLITRRKLQLIISVCHAQPSVLVPQLPLCPRHGHLLALYTRSAHRLQLLPLLIAPNMH